MNKQIKSVKTVALISSWCAQFESGSLLNSAFKLLWKLYQNTISSPARDSEVCCKYIDFALASYLRIYALVRIYHSNFQDFAVFYNLISYFIILQQSRWEQKFVLRHMKHYLMVLEH